jgi:cytochrome P450
MPGRGSAVDAPALRVDDPAFYDDDVFATYAWYRRNSPVHLVEDLSTWVLTRYDDIRYVAKTPTLFSVSHGVLINDVVSQRHLEAEYLGDAGPVSSVDPPRHTALRRLIAPAVTPQAARALEASMQQVCFDVLAEIKPGTEVEWMSEVSSRVPLLVLCEWLGLPTDNVDDLARWSDALLSVTRDLADDERAAAIGAMAEMQEYLAHHIEDRRSDPREDFISLLVQADQSAELSAADIIMWATVMLGGGHETVSAGIGNLMAALASHPDQRRALADDPSLVAGAVEEGLRWCGPTRGALRFVMADTTLDGVQLREGQYVYVIWEAGNRDEQYWDDPERFEIRRPVGANLAFGSGHHLCPGASLARTQTNVLLQELLTRFSSWEIGDGATKIESAFRRGYATLPLIFEA